MAVTFADYLNVLSEDNIRKPKVKIELLRYEDETVYDEITGYTTNQNSILQITNKNGRRRNISLDLVNVSKRFLPSPDGIWLRQKIRIWAGLEINGEDYLFKQGVFIIENPSAINQLSNKRLSFNALDKFSLADGTLGGETDAIYSIPVGTTIPDAVRLILQPSTDAEKEIFFDPIDPIIDANFDGETTPYTIEVGDGDPVGDILLELAGMVSANVYYNENGRLVFEEDIPDSEKGHIMSFEEGDFNFLDTNQNFLNSKVFNAVRVVGANINGDIAIGYVENNNLLSDSSIPNVGWKRVYPVNDPNIYTDALALDRAKYELKRVTNLQSEHTMNCVPMYHLDVDKIIILTSSSLELSRERYLINSISLPISTGGTMTINCAESIDLTFE